MKKILAFDLDDVICFRDKKYEKLGPKKYNHCIPNNEIIKFINKLYNTKKYKITIYTARGMTQFRGDLIKIKKIIGPITKSSLDKWGLQYDELIFGKIHYDFLLDDKSFNFDTKNHNINEIQKLIKKIK